MSTGSCSSEFTPVHDSPRLFYSSDSDSLPAAISSNHAQSQTEQHHQLQHENRTSDSVTDRTDILTKISLSQAMVDSPTIGVVMPAPHTLLSSSSSSEGDAQSHAQLQADAQVIPAILMTSDLFQQMSAGDLVPADGSDATHDLLMQQWQANSIFDSLAGTAAASAEQVSLRLGGSTCPGDNTCNADADPSQTLSSPNASISTTHGEGHEHTQVFSELFDTQLSQFLTTQEEALSVSAELQASAAETVSIYSTGPQLQSSVASEAVSAHSKQPGQLQPAHAESATTADTSFPVRTSGSVADPESVADLESVDDKCTHVESATIARATPVSPTAAAVKHPSAHDNDAVTDVPLAAAVSTAQLEIMGWDMFADTLGTFRLLSDTDSDAESTTNLLPEPSELAPITPESGLLEPRMMQHQVHADSPYADMTGRHASVHGADMARYRLDADSPLVCVKPSLEMCHSQDLAHFDLLESTGHIVKQDVVARDVLNHSPLSPLEWEYHAMMLDGESGSERYPGMHSDADEFDGHDGGCLGHSRDCAVRFEQCMSCYPCATCACYPAATLRPGRHHHKGIIRRMWASVRARGSSCIHPKFPHERYI